MDFERRGPGAYRVRAADVPWDRILVLAPVLIVVLMAVYLVATAVYKVDEHEQAVVMRFGKEHKTVPPGLHFCIPLIDQVLKVSVAERALRLPFGHDAQRPQGLSTQEEIQTLMLTGDLNAAAVEWTIQWKVVEADKFLFRFHRQGDPDYAERIITTIAQTTMNRLMGDYSIDEVLTGMRHEIATKAQESMQEILDAYSCGVRIRALQMQRVSPPSQVRPAFDRVNASLQTKIKFVNEANRDRNQRMPKAEAEKDKLIQEASGYADRRVAEASGEIDALLAKYHAYERAPEVTRQRLYIEAMEEILTGVRSKMIIDADLQGKVLPLLPLEQGAKP